MGGARRISRWAHKEKEAEQDKAKSEAEAKTDKARTKPRKSMKTKERDNKKKCSNDRTCWWCWIKSRMAGNPS
jgi:hypothetical protein